jgi:hypothetical protein
LLWRIQTEDDKDDHHIDRVEKDKNDKWPLKQFIKPFTPKFKVWVGIPKHMQWLEFKS